ncbi:L,D-transpeptidase family protein [Desulforamulus ruminis]|uniref:ErfK/YbiS/YcfS/YnhG family protein n=1 Tax=Desulforamulus ruminis (strain ATCC 23193 / DSM 2154 / NCIMB 8452 / DL) TaxID=696281 RepID=F6DJY4_DESRL|nr:peptidoglycan-binding protein [Desulforamulus ruminis]AEG59198.1 ErfK/YbiS/YcfS/YnhG family protein [Desulforamulus ruminis DSM 2154]
MTFYGLLRTWFFFTALLFLWATPCGAYCPTNEDVDRTLTLSAPLMQGEDVIHLQKELQALHYYNGPISGFYGAQTHAAVIRFQQEHQLKADGVVDWKTWHTLALQIEAPVTKSEKVPPPTGEIAIIIDTTKRKLTVLSDGKPYKQFNVACGKPSTPSPVGSWRVYNKARNWGTGFGTRWIGLNVPWGSYGIHGTNKPFSIGSYASHGCIRMHNSSVEELYPWVSEGTPVYIIGNPTGVPGRSLPKLVRGDRGSEVYEVQRTLKRLGYYQAELDGIFGGGLETATKKFRQANGLPPDNCVDANMYRAMGL